MARPYAEGDAIIERLLSPFVHASSWNRDKLMADRADETERSSRSESNNYFTVYLTPYYCSVVHGSMSRTMYRYTFCSRSSFTPAE